MQEVTQRRSLDQTNANDYFPDFDRSEIKRSSTQVGPAPKLQLNNSLTTQRTPTGMLVSSSAEAIGDPRSQSAVEKAKIEAVIKIASRQTLKMRSCYIELKALASDNSYSVLHRNESGTKLTDNDNNSVFILDNITLMNGDDNMLAENTSITFPDSNRQIPQTAVDNAPFSEIETRTHRETKATIKPKISKIAEPAHPAFARVVNFLTDGPNMKDYEEADDLVDKSISSDNQRGGRENVSVDEDMGKTMIMAAIPKQYDAFAGYNSRAVSQSMFFEKKPGMVFGSDIRNKKMTAGQTQPVEDTRESFKEDEDALSSTMFAFARKKTDGATNNEKRRSLAENPPSGNFSKFLLEQQAKHKKQAKGDSFDLPRPVVKHKSVVVSGNGLKPRLTLDARTVDKMKANFGDHVSEEAAEEGDGDSNMNSEEERDFFKNLPQNPQEGDRQQGSFKKISAPEFAEVDHQIEALKFRYEDPEDTERRFSKEDSVYLDQSENDSVMRGSLAHHRASKDSLVLPSKFSNFSEIGKRHGDAKRFKNTEDNDASSINYGFEEGQGDADGYSAIGQPMGLPAQSLSSHRGSGSSNGTIQGLIKNNLYLNIQRAVDPAEGQPTPQLPQYQSFGGNRVFRTESLDYDDHFRQISEPVSNEYLMHLRESNLQYSLADPKHNYEVERKMAKFTNGFWRLSNTVKTVAKSHQKVLIKWLKFLSFDAVAPPLEELVDSFAKVSRQPLGKAFQTLLSYSACQGSVHKQIVIFALRLQKRHLLETVINLRQESKRRPILQSTRMFVTKLFYNVLAKYKQQIYQGFINITFRKEHIMRNYKGPEFTMHFGRRKRAEGSPAVGRTEAFKARGSNDQNNFFHFSRIIDNPGELIRNQQKRESNGGAILKSEIMADQQGFYGSVSPQMQSIVQVAQRPSQMRSFMRRFSSRQSTLEEALSTKGLLLQNGPSQLYRNEIFAGRGSGEERKISLLSHNSKGTSEAPPGPESSNLGMSQFGNNPMTQGVLSNLRDLIDGNIGNLLNDPLLAMERIDGSQSHIDTSVANEQPPGYMGSCTKEKGFLLKSTERAKSDKQSLPVKATPRSPRLAVQAEAAAPATSPKHESEDPVSSVKHSISERISLTSKDDSIPTYKLNEYMAGLEQLKRQLTQQLPTDNSSTSNATYTHNPQTNSESNIQIGDLGSQRTSQKSVMPLQERSKKLPFCLYYLFEVHNPADMRDAMARLSDHISKRHVAKGFFVKVLAKMTKKMFLKAALLQKKKNEYVQDIVITINKNYRKLVKKAYICLKNGTLFNFTSSRQSERRFVDPTDGISQVTDELHDVFSAPLSRRGELEVEGFGEEFDLNQGTEEDDFYLNLEQEYNQNAIGNLEVN